MKQLLLGTTLQSALIGSGSYTPAFPTAIVNGGFETGDFTGWAVTGSPQVKTEFDNGVVANDTPYEGTYGCFGGTNTALSSISQSISVPQNLYTSSQLGTLGWSLSYWGNNYSTDDLVSVEILFYDTASVFLGRYDQPARSNYYYGLWNEVTASGVCPANTAFATITFTFTRVSGANNNAAIDLVDLSFYAIAPGVDVDIAASRVVLGSRPAAISTIGAITRAVLAPQKDAMCVTSGPTLAVLGSRAESLAVQSAKSYAIIIP